MAPLLRRWGSQIAGTKAKKATHWTPLSEDMDLWNQAMLQRNIPAGGTLSGEGILVSGDGDYSCLDCPPVELDNRNNRYAGFVSSGATFIPEFRYAIKVSDPVVSVTPKPKYGLTITTMTTDATVTDENGDPVASTNGVADNLSEAGQYQKVRFTVPQTETLWDPQFSVSGTGGNAYRVWVSVKFGFYARLDS